jgi:hypothetical protein
MEPEDIQRASELAIRVEDTMGVPMKNVAAEMAYIINGLFGLRNPERKWNDDGLCTSTERQKPEEQPLRWECGLCQWHYECEVGSMAADYPYPPYHLFLDIFACWEAMWNELKRPISFRTVAELLPTHWTRTGLKDGWLIKAKRFEGDMAMKKSFGNLMR